MGIGLHSERIDCLTVGQVPNCGDNKERRASAITLYFRLVYERDRKIKTDGIDRSGERNSHAFRNLELMQELVAL
jgi:hypothetical protein